MAGVSSSDAKKYPQNPNRRLRPIAAITRLHTARAQRARASVLLLHRRADRLNVLFCMRLIDVPANDFPVSSKENSLKSPSTCWFSASSPR